MTIDKKPELLSPAGSMESVYAAVNNGCDAIYLGGKQFSARHSAGNFTDEEMNTVFDYCHLRGVKVYVTVNTLYKDKELSEFLSFIKLMYEKGADAFIVQDLGAAKLIHSHLPEAVLHASTQLTSNTVEDVRFLEKNGFTKIVLSRELSLKEIELITQNTDAEIETFVHGAICVSYSGQCIMSSMLGGRSGNRGRCAQTCRLPYSLVRGSENVMDGYLLSPKDMQTITILPKLIEAGISSFKIEGRMKNPEYVAGVTGVYRKYIDLYHTDPLHYKVEENDIKVLLQLFNRGGFSEGYYETHSGSEMMSVIRPKTWGLKTGFIDNYNEKLGRATIRTREPLIPGDGIEVWTKEGPHSGTNISRNSKAGEVISLLIEGKIGKNDVVYKTHDKALSDAMKKTWEKDSRKKMISGSFQAEIGKPFALSLWDFSGNRVFVEGGITQQAQNKPMDREKISQQLMKTGATPFAIENMELKIDDNIYIGISELNELRRRATDALSEAILKKTKKEAMPQQICEDLEKAPVIRNKKMNVLVSTKQQFEEAVVFPRVEIIYFELNEYFEENLEDIIKTCQNEGKKLYAALPRIEREYSNKLFYDFIQSLKMSNIDGFLIRSVGQYDSVKECEKEIAIDYNLNIMNAESVAFWNERNVTSLTVSPELNLQEINTMAQENCEMLVYGYLPLMTTHQCPVGAYAGGKTSGIYCSEKDKPNQYSLKDRKGLRFPLLTDCRQCVAYILNAKPLFTLKFFDEILFSPTGSVRLIFTKENAKETRNILNAYGDMLEDDKNPSIDARLLMDEMIEKGSTKGHYFRGVE